MVITMNRFRVVKDAVADFEAAWRDRDPDMTRAEGFAGFHLLRGPEQTDHALYASHTVWKSREDFIAWAWARRQIHEDGGRHGQLCIGGPAFEYFSVIRTVMP